MQSTMPRRRFPAHEHDQAAPVGRDVNVSDFERWASALGGAAVAVFGVSRGRAEGIVAALAGAALIHRGVTGHCYLYDALGLDTSAQPENPNVSIRAGHGVRVEKAVTIARPAEELFRFWRDFENLPRIMSHLESVECRSARKSHWVAKGPLGLRVSWDAEIYNEEPDRMIAWRSLEGSQIDTAGSVHFEPAPGNRGTYVRVNLKFDPPAGKAGAAIARLFGRAPAQEIEEDLRRFKQQMEAGEVATTTGQTSCRR